MQVIITIMLAQINLNIKTMRKRLVAVMWQRSKLAIA